MAARRRRLRERSAMKAYRHCIPSPTKPTAGPAQGPKDNKHNPERAAK
jgi:hypothetical protein